MFNNAFSDIHILIFSFFFFFGSSASKRFAHMLRALGRTHCTHVMSLGSTERTKVQLLCLGSPGIASGATFVLGYRDT